MDAPDSDAALVRRTLNGTKEAFRALVERYEGMVYDVTTRYAATPADGEDLAQDVFLRAYRRLDTLEKPGQFASWLYGITLNRCRDYAKNVRRSTYAFSRTEAEDAAALADDAPRQDREVEAEERRERLWRAVETLDPTYATPFLMKYRDGLTYKAMSDRLDVSVSALKVRVHRARKKLRTIMEGDDA